MGEACPPAGSGTDHIVLPVRRSIARSRSSVAAAMKTRPLAVVTAPPLFGVPMLNGSIVGNLKGPFLRAVPSGRSHKVLPVAISMARIPPYGGRLHMSLVKGMRQPALTLTA